MCKGTNRFDHQGNLQYSIISRLQLCILNNGTSIRLNRPAFSDTVVDITISYNQNLFLTSNWDVLHYPYDSDHYPVIINIPPRPLKKIKSQIQL